MLARRVIPSALRISPLARSRPFFNQRSLIRPSVTKLSAGTSSRLFASKSTIDEKIEEIQDQYGWYATAKDEFEIAAEETEKMSVYAQEDRNAAREELDKLKELFNEAIADPQNGEEIRGRIGQRIRELDNAVQALEDLAQNQD